MPSTNDNVSTRPTCVLDWEAEERAGGRRSQSRTRVVPPECTSSGRASDELPLGLPRMGPMGTEGLGDVEDEDERGLGIRARPVG
jgi:hypothetical protein